jgi:hypothetical protein
MTKYSSLVTAADAVYASEIICRGLKYPCMHLLGFIE